MYDGLELMKEQLNSMSSKAISKKIANEEVSNETGKEVIINKRIKNNNIFEEDDWGLDKLFDEERHNNKDS